jgi:hypothetical protein
VDGADRARRGPIIRQVENQNSGTVAATAATTILQYDFYNATTHDVTFADDGVTATDHGRPASSPPRPQLIPSERHWWAANLRTPGMPAPLPRRVCKEGQVAAAGCAPGPRCWCIAPANDDDGYCSRSHSPLRQRELPSRPVGAS